MDKLDETQMITRVENIESDIQIHISVIRCAVSFCEIDHKIRYSQFSSFDHPFKWATKNENSDFLEQEGNKKNHVKKQEINQTEF